VNNLREAALLRWKKKLKEDLSKIRNNKKNLIKKAAVCGFLAGDGSVQIRKEKPTDKFYRYQLDFFPDDKKMLNTYLRFVKEIYELSPTIRRRDNMFTARTSQRVIVHDLTNLCKFGLYKWSFPSKLFKIKGAKEAWLRAFFSAEAYVGKKVIKIQSVNIKSIKEVRNMLSKLKIKGNYYEYVSKNENNSKVGMIFVNEKESRLIYYKKIGFWHSKKEKVLRESLGL
jgi:hypothetical protein